MGPQQSAEEAAAPQLPEIIPNESASVSSLVDVDAPSVRTVPSDFLEQDIQTETQAARIEREQAAAEEEEEEEEARAAKAAARGRRGDGRSKARSQLDSTNAYLARVFAGMGDGAASAVVVGNLAAVVGVSAWLGYRAWGLYDSGRLGWKSVGIGAAIVGAVSAVEVVLGRFIYKPRHNSKEA